MSVTRSNHQKPRKKKLSWKGKMKSIVCGLNQSASSMIAEKKSSGRNAAFSKKRKLSIRN